MNEEVKRCDQKDSDECDRNGKDPKKLPIKLETEYGHHAAEDGKVEKPAPSWRLPQVQKWFS